MKKLLTTDDAGHTTLDGRQTSNDHNSSPYPNGSGELKMGRNSAGFFSFHSISNKYERLQDEITYIKKARLSLAARPVRPWPDNYLGKKGFSRTTFSAKVGSFFSVDSFLI